MRYSSNDIKGVWENGLVAEVKAVERHKFLSVYTDSYEWPLSSVLDYEDKLKVNPLYPIAKRQVNNIKSRNKHYRSWIKKWLWQGYKIAFLTITFSDDLLNSCNEKTRRTYVSRFLKNYPGVLAYIANVDFGSTTEREHYHSLVALVDDFDFSIFTHRTKDGFLCSRDIPFKYGKHQSFSLWELVAVNWTESDIYRLTNYTNKLINHGLKMSGKGIFPIFSRKRG